MNSDMSRRHFVSLIGIVVTAAFAATFFSDPRAEAQGVRTPRPGEGVFCAWAIYTVVTEVGRRCHPGENAEVQAELERSVSRIDAYVVANTNPPVTPQQIEEFKRQQGHLGEPQESLCRGDPDQLYRSITEQGASAIRESVDGLVSQPGEPTWGTCF